MKLRLLFTIIIPALCGALGMEMRGMEMVSALAAKATGALDEWRGLEKDEKALLDNLRKNTKKSEFQNIFNALCDEVKIQSGEGRRKAAFQRFCYKLAENKTSILVENLYDLVYLNSLTNNEKWLEDSNVASVSLALITHALCRHRHDAKSWPTETILENFASEKCTLTILKKPLTPLLIAAYEKIVDLCKEQISTGTTDVTMLTGTQHKLVKWIRSLIIPAGKHMEDKEAFYRELNKAFTKAGDIDGLIDALQKRYTFAQSSRTKHNAVKYYLNAIEGVFKNYSGIIIPQNWLLVITDEQSANSAIQEKYSALLEGSASGAFDQKFIKEASELLKERSPEAPVKKLVPPFIENALSEHFMTKWLSESQELEAELEKWTKPEKKFDGDYFTQAIKTLREIADKNLVENKALVEKAQKAARFLAMHCNELFEKSHSKRVPGEDQVNAGFIAQVITEKNWKESLSAQTMLFDLIGLKGCIYYTQANAASNDTQKLSFIKQFLTFKQEEQEVADLFKQEATEKRLLAICTSQAMKKDSAVKKVEIPVAQKSAENPKDEVVISVEKPAAAISKAAAALKAAAQRRAGNSGANPGIIGTPVLKIAAEKPKAPAIAIPESPQATLSKEIPASHPTQQKSSWKPAIVTTAVVAGFGAACWYQWNTVKAFAQQYMPESVANIFARFQKASA